MSRGSRELDRLRADLAHRFAKYADKGRIWRARYYLSRPQYKTLLLYRLSKHFGSFAFLGQLFGYLYGRCSRQSGLEILTPDLGGGVIMPHWGRIVLNADRIGDNFYVFHNVTIGNDYQTGRPTIGDNVFVGTGAVIIGGVQISDNVVIGAGSVVNSDILSYSLVAGNPARVIRTIDDAYVKNLIGLKEEDPNGSTQ